MPHELPRCEIHVWSFRVVLFVCFSVWGVLWRQNLTLKSMLTSISMQRKLALNLWRSACFSLQSAGVLVTNVTASFSFWNFLATYHTQSTVLDFLFPFVFQFGQFCWHPSGFGDIAFTISSPLISHQTSFTSFPACLVPSILFCFYMKCVISLFLLCLILLMWYCVSTRYNPCHL